MQITDWLNTKLGQDIWEKKYRHNNETFEQWLDRVSGGNKEIRQLIIEKKFIFGGRILANRGLHKECRKITFSNCYVIAPPEDSIESIFDCAKKLARTYSYGGGCGVDISKLAPRGAKINNAAKQTSGSTSFMDLYSLVTELIGQSGRRGALMISIDCTHPDLEEFINIKSDLNKVTKANISVRINDDFIEAIKQDKDWELTYTRKETNETIKKVVSARKLFKKLAEMNWGYAEPGMINWSRICNWTLLSGYDNFKFAGLNPCAEQPLPAGGSCLLGSINLSEFVINPFTVTARFDFDEFKKTVKKGVIALNEVLHEGLPLHPLEEQRESVNNWRQIGLGICGWHDCLIKLGERYGSERSLQLGSLIAKCMINHAIESSANLTDTYGQYPKYNKESLFKSRFFQENITDEVKKIVEEKGLANGQLLTIAPTGSIGTMLGVSTGIEPIYEVDYIRKTESLHGEDTYYKVYTPIIEEYMELTNESTLPDFINCAMNLNYKERIEMQAVWQRYIDASISSTVNLPENTTVNDIENLYMLAWERGLKGVTVYRNGCKRDGILSNKNPAQSKEENNGLTWGTTLEATDDLIGRKKKIITGCGSLHVQGWFDPANGRLMELYLSKGSKGGCNSFMVALSRTISAGLRTGLGFDYAIDQLKSAPVCASYAVRTAIKKDTSSGNCCPAAIASALIEMQKDVFNELLDEEEIGKSETVVTDAKNKCPECGAGLKFYGGCHSCNNCGYSACN